MSALRAALGVAAGLFARAYLTTLRIAVVADPALDPGDARPWVLVFWHGEQFGLLAWPRRRPTVVLVSLSSDGQIQARALLRIGLAVERGSSSRGGAAGLAAMVRRLRRGHDAAFAVDGPRGPRFALAAGAITAARASGGVLVPIGAQAARSFVFARSWDRFRLPFPFTRVTIRLGAPLDPNWDLPTLAIQDAIHRVSGTTPGVPANGSTGPRGATSVGAAVSALASESAVMVGSRPACVISSLSADAKSPST